MYYICLVCDTGLQRRPPDQEVVKLEVPQMKPVISTLISLLVNLAMTLKYKKKSGLFPWISFLTHEKQYWYFISDIQILSSGWSKVYCLFFIKLMGLQTMAESDEAMLFSTRQKPTRPLTVSSILFIFAVSMIFWMEPFELRGDKRCIKLSIMAAKSW